MTSAHGRLAAGSAALLALGVGAAMFAPASATGPAGAAPTASARVDCAAVLATHTRQAAFATAAKATGVPAPVLLAVSYLESRWDDHGASPSTSGGYGPMHLTDVDADLADGRGLGADRLPEQSLATAHAASGLTRLSVRQLTRDDAANICGGAALLADHQRDLGHPVGTRTDPAGWYAAVATYSTAADRATAARFADETYRVLRHGQQRTTNDGERVRLAAHPRIAPATRQLAGAGFTTRAADANTDCPQVLDCEWIPAPYEQYGLTPGEYGNHDLANRPNDLSIDYIVIHDTEATYDTTLDLVQDPTYVSWQYTVRSSDGHIAEHVRPGDVAWQAGNWYINSHSIGLEHEGFAPEGASWFTESMYRSSAQLVRYLTTQYEIPRDRAHIIGHDQVPGTIPSTVAGMHWDPGPYWDWEHYMRLLRAPITADPGGPGDLVTVRPGFEGNEQPVTGCETAGEACEPQASNFVYLHRRPRTDSPLVLDAGLHPDETESSTEVWDIGARAAAGHKLVVADRRHGWLKVWWLGKAGWIDNRPEHRSVVKAAGSVVQVADEAGGAVPVYGRAYPEEAAYSGAIPYQTLEPLQYSIQPGQQYVLADSTVATDYYYAKSYNDSVPDDHTVVRGDMRYYQIWFGHRIAYVDADDVQVVR